MLLGSVIDARTQEPVVDLIRTVDEMRPFVRYRLRGRPNDVDAVLQLIRERVWRCACRYDPSQGCANAFVFGITRNILRHEYAKHERVMVALDDDLESTSTPDPLQTLVDKFDTHRWMGLVADFVGEDDWTLVTELGFESDSVDTVCERHHITERTIRTVRQRVQLTATTVRLALAAADAGRPLTGRVLLDCLPEPGLREIALMLDDDAATIAGRLHIHPGRARARIAMTRQQLKIACVVLTQEVAA